MFTLSAVISHSASQVLRRCSSASKDVVTWEASNDAGEDLEDSRGEINFAAGDTSAPLNLIIRNDDVPELDETISFWLTKAEKVFFLLCPFLSFIFPLLLSSLCVCLFLLV